MAISINWATKVINIPQDYLTDLGGGVYELYLNNPFLFLYNFLYI